MKFDIPEIDDGRLDFLAASIHPLYRTDDGKLFYVDMKNVDLRGESYLWSACGNRRARGLHRVGSIDTYHTFGYHGLFKPSAAEVLAQIPQRFLDMGVTAFEIVSYPIDIHDVHADYPALNAGVHIARTALYV